MESADYNLRMRRLLRYLLMALVLLVVALVSALTAMRFAIHGREVTVPDLRGKTPAEAHHVAEDAGLAMSIERSYYSAQVPEGRVLSQAPDPGALVRRGWELRVALSLGAQRISVPQVAGASERAADLVLAQRGIEIESTAHVSIPGAETGQVIAQNPPANSPDVAAPKVSLLIADPAAPQAFVMPGFLGQPLGTATNTLRDAGFVLGKVTLAQASPPTPTDVTGQQAASSQSPTSTTTTPVTGALAESATSPSPASIIVSQEPPVGSKIFAGSAINFVVR